jgi:hypothetical protein
MIPVARPLNRTAAEGILPSMQILQGRGDTAKKRVLLQRRVGDLRLVLQGEGQPSDAEIDDHIAEAIEMARFVCAVLVVAEGPKAAGPDARQRAKMARAGLLRVRTAVVSDSVLARGIMTAISWVGAPIRGYASDHLFRAYEFLELSGPVRARIPEQLAAMRSELHGTSLPPRSTGAPAARSFDPILR